MTSLVLGQYENGSLVCRGHVTLGVGGENFRRIKAIPVRNSPPFAVPSEKNENAVWIAPLLVCTVKYMEKTEHGGMRQPVFKGLRNDKTPEECMTNGEVVAFVK